MMKWCMMKWYLCSLITVLGCSAFMPPAARAATCVNGVYNAGCAGPNGAAAVHKTPYASPSPAYRPPSYYHPPGTVTCVNGVYRAGCAGPNGAAVVRKPY